MPEKLYIGLMSGTSVDCVDAVLVSFSDIDHQTKILARHEHPFPAKLKTQIEAAIKTWNDLDRNSLTGLDKKLGLLYAEAVNSLLDSTGLKAADITAVGCHGQTVSHQPEADPPFTLQLGDGAILSTTTGIRVVNDFRTADIELGGQGAPLVPAFHEWAFAASTAIAVVNIGGIANISLLHPDNDVAGYDTGPGNTLLDAWCLLNTGNSFDKDGSWAQSGQVNKPLLTRMLADPYFDKPAPKSTGREYFNPDWLQQLLASEASLPAADIQATLTELTATTIIHAATSCKAKRVYICGGGALNTFLMQRIAALAEQLPVMSTDSLGIPALWVEAVAFAWLAKCRLEDTPAGRPSVTGASHSALLGVVHNPFKT